MNELWTSLIPLGVASALVPAQIVITVLLLRSSAGRMVAVAWVAGMTTVRLLQGVVFGLVLGSAGADDAGSDGPGIAASLLLLAVAAIFYVGAAKQLLGTPDEDAPPPRWMAALEGITPRRAFLLGVGLLAIGAKFWVFTLGAISAIETAGLSQGAAILAFLAFVVLAEATHLLIVGIAFIAPDRATVMLDAISGFLERNNRVIVIALGVIFGTWFLLKALGGLGIL